MLAKDWSTITLITLICVATLTNLFSPVFCFRIHDLDDFPIEEKPKIKLSHAGEKLLDDIEDHLDADLIPPNFHPDPLLPGNGDDDENFEGIGQLNKERIGKGKDDPFNRYIGNVFDSLPKAKDIFEALKLNEQLNLEDVDLSAFPPELLIPLLMDPRFRGVDEDEGQESSEKQDKSLKMVKLLDDKNSNNKSDKSSSKDHGDRKLVGKLISLPKSSTTLTDKDTTIKPMTGKPSDPREEVSIDENEDEITDEDENQSKKSTTKSGKSKHNPFKWLSKSKSTTPKIGKKGHGKTTTDSGKVASTTKKPESYDRDEDDDDDDLSLNSTNSTTTSTESSKPSSSTIQPSTNGKSSTSAPTKGSKANKSSTSSSTTSQSTASDPRMTTNNSTSSPLTTTSKTKSPQISTTSTEKSTTTSKKDEDEDEDNDDYDDDDDADKIDATTEDQVDAFLSSLDVGPEQSKDNKKATSSTPSTTTTNSIELELEHSDKHNKTTVSNSTSTPTGSTDKSTTIKSDEANKKSTSSTTKQPESKSTIKPTTNVDNPDTFPVVSVTRSKAKSERSTTHRPSLTTKHHKTSRHPSTTPSPTLRPYVSDNDGLYLPIWNPDVFP